MATVSAPTSVQTCTQWPDPMCLPAPTSYKGKGLFSVAMSGLPPRQVQLPPLPCVIARSNEFRDMVDLGNKLMHDYPEICKTVYRPFIMEDYFDNFDIHIHSPEFCKKVLDYIAGYNHMLIARWVVDFTKARRDPEYLPIINAVINSPDPDIDREGAVLAYKECFGETDYGRLGFLFLSHVARCMKFSARQDLFMPPILEHHSETQPDTLQQGQPVPAPVKVNNSVGTGANAPAIPQGNTHGKVLGKSKKNRKHPPPSITVPPVRSRGHVATRGGDAVIAHGNSKFTPNGCSY
jgi:hypothetical protein